LVERYEGSVLRNIKITQCCIIKINNVPDLVLVLSTSAADSFGVPDLVLVLSTSAADSFGGDTT
jgi:hypothetical protein